MRLAQAGVSIDAPVEVVWEAMLDLGTYALWNPFILRVDAPAPVRVGDDITLHVRFRGGRSVASRERITTIEGPAAQGATTRARLEYEFRGRLHLTGMVRGRRLQTLEQPAGGSTQYRTEELFHGMLAFALPIAAVQDGFQRHAKALKRHAEELAS